MSAISRRTFVGIAATTAVCAGVGGLAWTGEAGDGLLRPPGAQDATWFASTCIKCDRCRSVCPTNVVGVAHIEDGLLAARTPVLNFHKGYCDFCDKCLEVCPTQAIKPFDPMTDKMGMAIVQKDRCLAYFQGCVECEKACDFEAITLDSAGHPVVDPEKCNGCGKCENICPALVYRSFSGGTRRGIVVVAPTLYERIGSTAVEDESGMKA